MTEMIAYCGLICQTCPIYLATRQVNAEEQARMKIEIVRRCREHYGMNIELADVIDCDGCRTEGGRLFSGCKKCHIRNCVRARGLENCAYCADYACEQLEAHFKKDPTSRPRLDQIRSR
jgi:predicted metal-binding transcription factor (methanogenesis marker protein 9)